MLQTAVFPEALVAATEFIQPQTFSFERRELSTSLGCWDSAGVKNLNFTVGGQQIGNALAVAAQAANTAPAALGSGAPNAAGAAGAQATAPAAANPPEMLRTSSPSASTRMRAVTSMSSPPGSAAHRSAVEPAGRSPSRC